MKLYINFEVLDRMPNTIAKNRDIRKPINPLNKVILIIIRKDLSLTISIKFIKVFLIVGIITSLFINFDNKNHMNIIISFEIIEYFLSIKIKFLIW